MPYIFSLFLLLWYLRVYPFLSLPFLHSCLLESECFCRKASTFSREIFLPKVFVCVIHAMRTYVRACVYVCVCAYARARARFMCVNTCSICSLLFRILCLAVPNGMGVEAGDALLDEGPQSLPAMRLWTFCNFRSSDSRENKPFQKIQIWLSTTTSNKNIRLLQRFWEDNTVTFSD